MTVLFASSGLCLMLGDEAAVTVKKKAVIKRLN